MIERPAKCLPVLRAQLDVAYPNRKHTLDYYKGDAAHAARESDHNPDPQGIIHAYDITHDPANGCDVQAVADTIIASRDPRVSYMIHNRRIVNSKVSPWVWRAHGDDPHLGHLHLSVLGGSLADDLRPWALPGANSNPQDSQKHLPVSVPNFRSLAGGFFSSTPFDTKIPTSIRTNNPGALNASPWVKAYPGCVGDKVTSMSGASANNTAIFETPEQGVAVWWELMKRYRAAGATTISQIINKYGGTGQDYSAYIDFVVKRLGLPKSYEIKLTGDDVTLTKFAKAMWRYEAGRETPLTDVQIAYGFALARKGGGVGGGGAGAIIGTGVAGGAGVGGVVVTNKIKHEGMTAGNVAIIAMLMIAAGIGIYFLVTWLRSRGSSNG